MSPKRPRVSTKIERAAQIHNGPSLLSLPTELILHIASTYPTVEYTGYHDTYEENFERREALKALSQTSRALRDMFLHLLWECFETVHCPSNRSNDWLKFTAEKLERLSKGLLENPEIAAHVRIAVIGVQDNTSCTYLIPCLRSLSNLHTLSISLNGTRCYQLFSSATFPQIRTLKTAACYAPILIPCCPKVTAVISTARMLGWSHFRNLFDENEKSLEELEGFSLSEEGVKNIVNVAPNLRRISFPSWIPPETLGLLRPLNHLQTITMYAHQHQVRRHPCKPKSDDELDAWVATAVSVLRGNEVKHGSGRGKKRVKMRYEWVDYTHTEDDDDRIKKVQRTEDIEVE